MNEPIRSAFIMAMHRQDELTHNQDRVLHEVFSLDKLRRMNRRYSGEKGSALVKKMSKQLRRDLEVHNEL